MSRINFFISIKLPFITLECTSLGYPLYCNALKWSCSWYASKCRCNWFLIYHLSDKPDRWVLVVLACRVLPRFEGRCLRPRKLNVEWLQMGNTPIVPCIRSRRLFYSLSTQLPLDYLCCNADYLTFLLPAMWQTRKKDQRVGVSDQKFVKKRYLSRHSLDF